MTRFLRYALRILLAVLLLIDVKVFLTLFFPIDRLIEPSPVDWLLTALFCLLFLGLQVLVVWLDSRIGRCKTCRALLRSQSLPWLLLGVGVASKGALTVWTHFVSAPSLVHFLLTTDPLALRITEAIVPLVFDQRRLAPTPAELLTFEVLFVALFGLECFLAGLLIPRMWHRVAPPQIFRLGTGHEVRRPSATIRRGA